MNIETKITYDDGTVVEYLTASALDKDDTKDVLEYHVEHIMDIMEQDMINKAFKTLTKSILISNALDKHSKYTERS